VQFLCQQNHEWQMLKENLQMALIGKIGRSRFLLYIYNNSGRMQKTAPLNSCTPEKISDARLSIRISEQNISLFCNPAIYSVREFVLQGI
jgi:hypothetical protein